ncbi:MAG: Hsp70 family protein [Deltaproteobacteria bacterium]|jgi:hypothetical protein|nr:Hsp70 family protein [Deltaproteobacteria bacterium]
MVKKVIGIDFGTSNSYVTICSYGKRDKSPLHLSGKNPGIDTCVLYSDRPGADPSLFPMIGEQAAQTYGQADAKAIATEGYRYHSEFKPNIVANTKAKQYAIDFFKAIDRDARLNFNPLSAAENLVIVGVPSEANDCYRQTLREILQKAGFGQAEIRDEPIGALLTELGGGRFNLSDIMKGLLVIDFGGGTCDFAFLQSGKVVRSWGDFGLGGRLFDDLFFRWFIELNPGSAEKLRREKREILVRDLWCRRIKEEFSETIARNPKAAFTREVGRYGQLVNLTKSEFIERARHYQPTDSFIEYHQKNQIPLSPKLQAGQVDLIAWFGETLRKYSNQIETVSLSGGSSKWYFVSEICIEELKIAPDKILTSFNPYGAISEGLSILPSVLAEFEDKKQNIEKDKPDFLDEIKKNIKSSVKNSCQTITDSVLIELFDRQIVETIKSARQQKFTINQLESDLQEVVRKYEGVFPDLLDQIFCQALATLNDTSFKNLDKWLEEHGLKTGGHKAEPPPDSWRDLVVDPEVGKRVSERLAGTLAKSVTALMASIVATISANLCGGAGLSLLAAGPIGLIAGAAGGLVLSGLAWGLGSNRLKEKLKKISLPGKLLELIISDSKLVKLRHEFGESIDKDLDKLTDRIADQISEVIEPKIEQVISNLGLINAL